MTTNRKEKGIPYMPDQNLFAQEMLVYIMNESFGSLDLKEFKEEMVHTSPRIFVLANYLGLIKDEETLERYKDSKYPISELKVHSDGNDDFKTLDMRDILDLLSYNNGDLLPTAERRTAMPTAEQVARAKLKEQLPDGQEFSEGHIRMSSSLAVAAEYLNLIKDRDNAQYAESRGGIISSLSLYPRSWRLSALWSDYCNEPSLTFRDVLKLLCYWHGQPCSL